MYSRIAEEIGLEQSPVALLFSNDKPDGAVGFAEGRWGCVMSLLNAAAAGRTAVYARGVGCRGGQIGLGLCDTYAGTPGGIEYFLSCGRGEGFPEGERYRKTPELARAFVEQLPRVNLPYDYVVLKALERLAPGETPEVVIFLVNPDQLTALVVLANYGRATADNVIIPFASGCQSIGILPYAEAKREAPRAVVGTLDVSARPFMAADQLTFAMPLALFREMEANVEGSFLGTAAWAQVQARITGAEK